MYLIGKNKHFNDNMYKQLVFDKFYFFLNNYVRFKKKYIFAAN